MAIAAQHRLGAPGCGPSGLLWRLRRPRGASPAVFDGACAVTGGPAAGRFALAWRVSAHDDPAGAWPDDLGGLGYPPARRWRAPRRGGPLRRDLDGRVAGGVAAGISRRVGVDRAVVRTIFVLSTLSGGVGIAVYVLAWLFVPLEGERESVAMRAIDDRRGVVLALALVPALAVSLLVASLVGATWLTTISWPLFIAAGAAVLVWRNVSAAERAAVERVLGPIVLRARGRRSRRRLLGRVATGVLVGVLGVVVVAGGHHNHGLLRPLAGAGLVAAGAVIVFGPWWLRVARDLVDERQARVRAEERAEMAARVHDSVLQTLALIQRRADNPHEVVKLARSQERELRNWLFEGRSPGAPEGEDPSLSPAVERIQREVEAVHGVSVEAVVVGDCGLDENLRSLVEAGREATVNAAKFSGVDVVSVFVEVETDRVTMYVRDRGKGFEESAVPHDRKGLAESIRGRMARHGGEASVRSAAGEGTEVTLTMPRVPS